MLLFWINVHLSQNWHLFYLIKPTTKEWPLSTQACQTLDSHIYIKIYLCVWSTRTVLVHSSKFGERTNRCWMGRLGKSVRANQGRTGKTGSSICPARSHTLPRSALASNRREMILSWLPLEVEGLQFWCSSRNIKSCKTHLLKSWMLCHPRPEEVCE